MKKRIIMATFGCINLFDPYNSSSFNKANIVNDWKRSASCIKDEKGLPESTESYFINGQGFYNILREESISRDALHLNDMSRIFREKLFNQVKVEESVRKKLLDFSLRHFDRGGVADRLYSSLTKKISQYTHLPDDSSSSWGATLKQLTVRFLVIKQSQMKKVILMLKSVKIEVLLVNIMLKLLQLHQ